MQRLHAIIDADGNTTRVARSPNSISLTAPGGQVTTLTLGANGYLASVVHPAQPAGSSTVLLSHDANGLLRSFTDERGGTHTFTYDLEGRIVRDRDARPGTVDQILSRQDDPKGYDVTLVTAEKRARVHGVRTSGTVAPGDQSSVSPGEVAEFRFTRFGNLETRSYKRPDTSTWTRWPDGTIQNVGGMTADPRRQHLWFPSSVTTQMGNLSRTVTETRGASFAVAGDPFSLSSFTQTWTVNGARTAQTVYTAPAGATPASWESTSPEGRKVKMLLDGRERVTRVEVGSEILPISYLYDAKGRLERVTQGTRVWQTTYDPTTGWVNQVAAPGPLTTAFTSRDPRGRPKSITLPGGRVLGLDYDAAGNLTSVTPPGRTAHGFTYDANNRVSSYVPPTLPSLASPGKDTLYTRDLDGFVTDAKVGALTASAKFDALARLESGTVNGNAKSFGYDALGRLNRLTAGAVTWTNTAFEGSLVTASTLAITSAPALPLTTLTRGYSAFFEPTSWNVANAATATLPEVRLAYDRDGLVSSAFTGLLSNTTTRLNFRRSAQTGLVTGAWWGATSGETTSTPWSETTTWSTYGELASYLARTGPSTGTAPTVYELGLVRDGAGRITQKTEKLGGTTTVTGYTYDAAGRLATETVGGTLRGTWLYDGNGNRYVNSGGSPTGATYDARIPCTSPVWPRTSA